MGVHGAVTFEATEVEDPAGVLPASCPQCEGEQVFLEYINLRRDTKTQRCESCGTVWDAPID
jgi:predicted RNA-binding Zn-ribbon protein involved in translation (DUF1610 family)